MEEQIKNESEGVVVEEEEVSAVEALNIADVNEQLKNWLNTTH